MFRAAYRWVQMAWLRQKRWRSLTEEQQIMLDDVIVQLRERYPGANITHKQTGDYKVEVIVDSPLRLSGPIEVHLVI